MRAETTGGTLHDQAAANETQPHLIQAGNQLQGVPFGGASEMGGCCGCPCLGLVLSPGALLGAAAAVRGACSLPDPLHLTHFLFFTQLPADNKLSIRSPQEHLQLPSLCRTSAWPRTNSSILNRSHMSHLQPFLCHNCPDLRGVLGN